MAKEKIAKTNAMRILDINKIHYETITYDIADGKIDGISVAEKTSQDLEEVYKTLVVIGVSKELYVFLIPVDKELSLKKAAVACKEKKVDMINVGDINKFTGYIRGGCSPIGMKKSYKTFINETINNLNRICVSGGKKGIQVKLDSKDLINITNAKIFDIIN